MTALKYLCSGWRYIDFLPHMVVIQATNQTNSKKKVNEAYIYTNINITTKVNAFSFNDDDGLLLLYYWKCYGINIWMCILYARHNLRNENKIFNLKWINAHRELKYSLLVAMLNTSIYKYNNWKTTSKQRIIILHRSIFISFFHFL